MYVRIWIYFWNVPLERRDKWAKDLLIARNVEIPNEVFTNFDRYRRGEVKGPLSLRYMCHSIGSHLRDLSNGIWQLEGSCSSQSASQIDSLIDNWEIAIRCLGLGTQPEKCLQITGMWMGNCVQERLRCPSAMAKFRPCSFRKLFYNCKKFHRFLSAFWFLIRQRTLALSHLPSPKEKRWKCWRN